MTLADDFEGFLRRKFNALGEVRPEYELGEDVPDSPAQSWAPPAGRVGTASRRKGPRIPKIGDPWYIDCKCGKRVVLAKMAKGQLRLCLEREQRVGKRPSRGTYDLDEDGFVIEPKAGSHPAGHYDLHGCA